MISGSTFIRNNSAGFCLWESMASFLPLVDELIVIDLGSTDGTLEILRDIAQVNSKIKLYGGQFSCIDAKAFADAANQCVELWSNPVGIFWQADEIPHPKMLKLLRYRIEQGVENLAFWRYQLKTNFQAMKWFPHPVHRLGRKGEYRSIGDGMNTDKVFGIDVCSTYDMGWFTKWGTMDQMTIPVEEMVLDVSMTGAFRDNIPERRRLHSPMWHENNDIEGTPMSEWIAREANNPDWTKSYTSFNIPPIMNWHVGKTRYEVRPELISAIKNNGVERILGL